MALYGKFRDISLFRSVNRELVNRIIQTEVDVYKISPTETGTNLYGESDEKVFFTAVRLACLIDFPDLENPHEEGIIDVKQNPIFHFLRDDLVLKSLYIEVGDIIEWNNSFWEIDRVDDHQLHMQRNPDTNKTITSDFGWGVSFSCYTHMTRRTKVTTERVRGGMNNNLYGE